MWGDVGGGWMWARQTYHRRIASLRRWPIGGKTIAGVNALCCFLSRIWDNITRQYHYLLMNGGRVKGVKSGGSIAFNVKLQSFKTVLTVQLRIGVISGTSNTSDDDMVVSAAYT